ncbi:PREDICTED: armadillo repeat protein deleted in velo-cardio-facial syndrome homolog isoform X1 [Amphimedon queenslandica]|uniref:Uncharacterized protein n=3 Tax=Amphimedon queenslandica TaxID=400682 RepID=A0A1X7VJN2_AMPQE|nr:PREDICTED: armadillo repeat protein deleted in velo-cardio-facial syndrome homolog isoform X1 [Amphimedon queenslandica]|eukprot:XP_019848878.1 PREDICTED: armadillo repeat protein deleted in velo-cardio-facial syndrome homolog isoform X1 [Amphimedon queenslandica]
MTSSTSNPDTWRNDLWLSVNDDDDHDSDTDSRLSGSVMVDSVMRRLQQKGYHSNHSGGGSGTMLDPIADHSLETDNTDGDFSNSYSRRSTEPAVVVNGYQQTRPSPSHNSRRVSAPYVPTSPKTSHRIGGGVGGSPGRRDHMVHPFTAGRRKDHILLSPVPENVSKSVTSEVGEANFGGPHLFMDGMGGALSGPTHRSMENVGGTSYNYFHQQHHKTSPSHATRPSPEGYQSPPLAPPTSSGVMIGRTGTPDHMTRSASDHSRFMQQQGGSGRRVTLSSHPSPYHQYHPPASSLLPGRSPQLPSRFRHHMTTSYHGDNQQFQSNVAAQHDSIEQHISSLGHANHHGSQHEPNLNDVVDYLSHSDPSTVANAASYIQHLAYGDDNMKAKIRQFGGIPALLSQVRNPDPRVQLAVLGALRNLSYGRANNESKSQIAQDAGLPNIVYLLRNNSQPEVRELVTSVLWNLSSCEDIKLRILQCSLKDIVDTILIPSTGYGPTYPAARDFSQRTSVLHWTAEMKNSLGAIRNISSAGVEARRFLRASNNLVDTLVWIVRAAATQENVDEKTVENAICILRNLSFQIEDEVDTQQGADDDIDSQWERQIQQEIEAAKEALHPTSKKTNKSFLLFCARPQGDSSNMRRQVNYHLNTPRNLATPDSTLLPKRPQAVRGASLLWQPEIIFPYLALLEKYTSTTDLMEAAAGAIQNLTACNWKWAVYQRHLIRKANGLTLLIEHLNHAHDTVVRSVSTALRNLSIDETNKEIIGQYGIEGIIPRIPYGQNSLGISESTTISLLCTLMELCIDNYNNTSTFRDCNGITPIARLTQSKEHTPKVVYAAHKLCSIISEYKVAKSVLKQEGWDSREYLRLFSEGGHNYNFELSHAGTHHPVGGGGGAAGGGASRRSSSEEKKKKRANSDPMEITRMAAQSQQQHSLKKDSTGSIPPALSNVAPAPPTSSAPISPLHIQDLIDPTYNIIPNPKDPPTATPPSDGLPTTVPPSNPGPISMYAEINDPSIEQVRKKSLERPQSRSDSRAHSRTGSQPHSEPRSSPIDPRSTTPHEGLSSDEQGEPGNAMYAQVDYNKKRESRKRREEKYKQEEQEKVLNNGAIDSWV